MQVYILDAMKLLQIYTRLMLDIHSPVPRPFLYHSTKSKGKDVVM